MEPMSGKYPGFDPEWYLESEVEEKNGWITRDQCNHEVQGIQEHLNTHLHSKEAISQNEGISLKDDGEGKPAGSDLFRMQALLMSSPVESDWSLLETGCWTEAAWLLLYSYEQEKD